ncbi:hypothetical protein Fleli_2007 [Bernardetia litoralis DSM 6794]|uniref:PrcB C-terminal domain-containing protein n=1 Tax=Bernardetia litoralis (strain ATCC 23117 / DSM 6794 / NBRC 15988 / NCIMB 1366 / Fx l1 / Sio-4) TaxID=880071 RepID=I4AKA6_BERLS|nr:hypothetical protein [Bernardetia litoralis]AFM04391.1 hypothetical protein Fleli_2007 [Bernardetia litoralis DSM 6794]
MKYLFILILLCFTFQGMAQTLDLPTNSECELFKEKKDFNKEERLQKIKKLEGKLVTIYFVKGKNNKIKSKYTGIVDLTLIKAGNSSLKNITSVLVVKENKGNGQAVAHFPLTDSKNYRIYLVECLEK